MTEAARPAGFRYFLPAYLSYALRDPSSAGSKFALLDQAQRDAVVEFLRAMIESDYREDAEHALREWR